MRLLRGTAMLQLLSGAGALAYLPTAAAAARRAVAMRGGSVRLAAAGPTPQELLAPKVQAGALGFEEIATIPRPGSQGLSLVAFSPDDRYVTCAPLRPRMRLSRAAGPDACVAAMRAADLGGEPGVLTRQLYAYDRETGETRQVISPEEGSGEEETFSKEEQLRRERARIMSTGVTSYSWAAKAERVLVPMDGALYVLDGVGAGAAPRRLFDPADAAWAEVGSGPILDAKLTADGARACFVWADEVCCCAVPAAADAAEPVRLTFGARGEGKTNGLADYCAQEEMNRYAGFWPSADGALVAFEEVDERHIAPFAIARHEAGPHARDDFRYPFAGAANPRVRLGVARAGAEPVWFDLAAPFGADFYLVRVDWEAAGTLLAQVQRRDQTALALLRLDPATGAATALHTERDAAWVNLHDLLRPLRGGGFLWATERDGWRHLWLHAADGAPARQLTAGAWAVEELVRLDEAAGLAYVLGTAPGAPLERHLYRVRLDGGAPAERLTREPGYHAGVAVAHAGGCFVDQHSSAESPVAAALCTMPAPAAAVPAAPAAPAAAAAAPTVDAPAAAAPPLPLYSARQDARVAAMGALLRPPRFVSFDSTDGRVELHAALYEPDAARFGAGPHPTVVSCYGGPHVQFVADAWGLATADLRAQFLRSQGYLVLKVDNRGSDRRGLAFEAAIKGKLGTLEVDDQVAAVDYAVRAGLADPARVGIYGWSYGGYLSAMALAKAPRVFRCAVAGAPVTSWDGYDTHYTERYMGGTPEELPEAYAAAAVMPYVGDIEGALMLVHGLVDENVHFRHTARLAQAMVDAQKSYELLCFPSERHSPRSQKDRTFMEQQIFAFLQRWLGPPGTA